MSFFIEVGSCDFDTCEKLIENGWNGIVIEPVKYYFDKLPKYSNIHYENLAINNQEGESEIHYIDPKIITEENDEWLKGISSLEGKTGPLSFEGNSYIEHFKNHKDCVLIFIRDANLKSVSETLRGYKSKKFYKKGQDKLIRNYGIGAQIIKALNIKNMILVTRSKKKVIGLDGYGIKITKQEIIK